MEPTQKEKYSTVLIISATDTKSMQVANWKLKWTKPIIVILILSSIVFAGLFYVFWEKYHITAQKKSELQQQVTDLDNATTAEIEAKLAELKQSEKSIQELQQYLQERGVTVPEVDFTIKPTGENSAAGGPEIKLTQPIPYIGNFHEQVDTLLEQIKTIPFGRPHDGSLSSGFGRRANPFTGKGGELHGGLDFRGKTGEPVTVTADGVVVFSGVQRGYGNVIIVSHKRNIKTYYAHLSALSVEKGHTISVGDEVGKLGSTGRSTGPHLHYEVRINNERKNPKPYIDFKKS